MNVCVIKCKKKTERMHKDTVVAHYFYNKKKETKTWVWGRVLY